TSGDHVIAAPVTLADDAQITVAPESSLSMTGELAAAGKKITKHGAGTLAGKKIRANSLIVVAGKVQILASATPASAGGASVVKSLSIAAGAQLDLTNN